MTGADAPTSTSGSVPAGEDKAKMTFKGAARLVVAARRFQAALNPTYTYGKRADSGGNNSNGATTAVSGWTRTDATSSSSPVEIAPVKATNSTTSPLSSPPLGSTPPKKVYDHHGHKGNLIFAPLPDVVVAAEKAS